MQLNIIITTILSCFYFVNTYSQIVEVKGLVTSKQGEKVSGAVVRVLNSSKGTISDSNGFFRLFLAVGDHQILVSCFNYASNMKRIHIYDDESIDITFVLDEKALDEVVVSPEKREENIINTNVSMTSLSASKIQDTRTWNLSNMVGLIPNYQYADVGVGYEQQLSMRGVSVFSNNPTIATYVDGVNSLDITANGFQLMDIDRIEVLRGPQGTLYGRNAMGGVINIITKKPSNKTSGFFEASVGNQGLQRYGGGYRTPLVKDKLFLGISGQFQRQLGYYGNDTTPSYTYLGKTFKGPADLNVRFGDADSYYANLFLKWFATKNLDLTLNLKAQDDKSTGPSSYFQAAVNDSFARANPYKFTVNRFGSDERKILNSSISLNFSNRHFSLVSISAYQYILQSYNNIDADYWTFDIAWAGSFNNKVGDAMPQGVLSQELRFSSPTNKSSRFKWTGGTYLFGQKYEYRTATVYVAPLASLFGYSGTDVNENNQNNSGIAFFGQGTYGITDRLDFTAGLRYDYENRKSAVSSFNIDQNGNYTYYQNDTNLAKSFHAFSPKAILSYRIDGKQNIYLSYSRGFRTGGINTATILKGFGTFNPEFSDNYELGYKTFSANKKILFTGTIFYMDWRSLQLDYRPDGINYITANIGDVHSTGAELEATILPIKNLQLDASIGLNNARYYNTIYLGNNISGNQTIMAPKSTWFTSAQYSIPLSKRLKGIIRAEWRRIGNQYFDLENKIRQPAYNLFNTRIGVTAKRMEVFFWVQNLFNQTYMTYAFPAVFTYALLNRPRSFGITITSRF